MQLRLVMTKNTATAMTIFWIMTAALTALAGLLVLAGARRGAQASRPLSEVETDRLSGARELAELDRMKARGLLDEAGKMKGSALVMEFPDRAALDEYLKNEPYVVEGVWQKIEVETMNVVLVNGEKA